MTTLAETHLQRLKSEHAPTFPLNSRGADRVQALAGVLHPFLPAGFRAQIDKGFVAIGEVGRPEPDAETLRFEDDSNAVVVTSGMMNFFYAIGRAMAGAATFTSNSTPTTKPAKSLGEVVGSLPKCSRPGAATASPR
jgi:hypothetical protein